RQRQEQDCPSQRRLTSPTGARVALQLSEGGRTNPDELEGTMADKQTSRTAVAPRQASPNGPASVSREQLIKLLNEDLAREYQAIIAYVVYSQVLKGAQYMNIAGELEKHAGQELQHALTIAKQIDYLGGMPTGTPKPVRLSDSAEDMLRFDLENENET